jgi:zinc transporter
MARDEGIVCAYVLDGAGGARRVDWAGIRAWNPSQGKLWIHLDRNHEHARSWLRQDSGIDPVLVQSLLEKGSRPRATMVSDQLMLLFLRGINLNPGENPVNTVSIRMFISADRIVSLRRQHLLAADDMAASLEAGTGPRTIGEFVTAIADNLTNRMHEKLASLRDELSQKEASLEGAEAPPTRSRLIVIQREAITLRRFLAPQRDALMFLSTCDTIWLDDANRLRIRETVDQVTRYVEDLDAGQEHAKALHDQIADAISERMNRNMYVLSIIAGIFLPLDFVTGLLGVNVGGVPGTNDPWGFVELTGGLLVLAIVLFVLFRYLKWLQPLKSERRSRSQD